jgi:hypothetical protein
MLVAMLFPGEARLLAGAALESYMAPVNNMAGWVQLQRVVRPIPAIPDRTSNSSGSPCTAGMKRLAIALVGAAFESVAASLAEPITAA